MVETRHGVDPVVGSVDIHPYLRYPSSRPSGGPGAAESFEPCQVREEAALRRSLWVSPGILPGGQFLTENRLSDWDQGNFHK